MSHDELKRLQEVRRLQEEMSRLYSEISAMNPDTREHSANGIRAALLEKGTWHESIDAPVLASFVKMQIGLDELAIHFAGRV